MSRKYTHVDVLVHAESAINIHGEILYPDTLKSAVSDLKTAVPVSIEFDQHVPPMGLADLRYEEGRGLVADVGIFKGNSGYNQMSLSMHGMVIAKQGNVVTKMNLIGLSLTTGHGDSNAAPLGAYVVDKPRKDRWDIYVESLE